jgi:hypothetical protein
MIQKLSYIKTRILTKILEKPIPKATDSDRKLIEKLQNNIKSQQSSAINTKEWSSFEKQVASLITTKDPRHFLRWNIIQSTMFSTNHKYTRTEYKNLKLSPKWNVWKKIIKEDFIGDPLPEIVCPKSSGNRIHHSYHLHQFEETTNTSILNYDVIFEFGGGYGSMRRVVDKLGFKGIYILFDLPVFSLLQQYYLNTLKIQTTNFTTDQNFSSENKTYCVSNFKQLEALLNKINTTNKKRLFIATWSLSETPLELRQKVETLTKSFSAFLIAYQKEFSNINNIEYFNNMKSKKNNLLWKTWEIPHLKGNSYLIGNK